MPKNQSLQSSYQKWVQSQFKTKEIADPYVINDYFKRLISPSIRTVDGQKKTAYFVMDYLQGEGGELGGKFFSPYSSSRLCFDLYSWLGSEVFCNQGYEITFEKYLPRLCLGRSNPYPNMDVMIRRGETLLFIESKFTETINYPIKNKVSQNNFGLPLSYSADLAKDLSCEDLKILEKYYYGSSEAAKRFREFFLKMDLLVKGTGLEGSDWFDLKQECTHLFGIFFYLLGSDPAHSVLTDFKGEIRQVLFYNIAYGFDFQKSEIAKKFLSEGNALIKGLLSQNQIDISFDYDTISVQKYYQTVIQKKNPLVFGLKNGEPVIDLLNNQNYYVGLKLNEAQKGEDKNEDIRLVHFFR